MIAEEKADSNLNDDDDDNDDHSGCAVEMSCSYFLYVENELNTPQRKSMLQKTPVSSSVFSINENDNGDKNDNETRTKRNPLVLWHFYLLVLINN